MHSFNKSIGHIPVLISDFRKIFQKLVVSGLMVLLAMGVIANTY